PRLGLARLVGGPAPAARRGPGAPVRRSAEGLRRPVPAVPQPGSARPLARLLRGRAHCAGTPPDDRGDPRPFRPRGRRRGIARRAPGAGPDEPRPGPPRGGLPRGHDLLGGVPGLLLLPPDVV